MENNANNVNVKIKKIKRGHSLMIAYIMYIGKCLCSLWIFSIYDQDVGCDGESNTEKHKGLCD